MNDNLIWKTFSFPIFLLGLVLMISACEPKSVPSLSSPTSTSPPAPSPMPSSTPTWPARLEPSPSPVPAEISNPLPDENKGSPTPVESCINLRYEENAQVELVSPSGTRILIDVYDPTLLSSPATEQDILLTTHTHWDHVNAEFQASFPGQQLRTEAGRIELPGLTIQGIPSAHNAADRLRSSGGTNYIYLIDTGELRIAHFGDIGQDALAPEQLTSLGEVDIAITQFANSYSDMSAANQKGFKLMAQVNPRLVIPTHIDLATAQIAAGQWQGWYTDQPSIQLCQTALPDQNSILFMGQQAQNFADRLNLPKMDW
jgi:L-ascorbate metabolism protein UlaG (beta-lactamase superfamily)